MFDLQRSAQSGVGISVVNTKMTMPVARNKRKLRRQDGQPVDCAIPRSDISAELIIILYLILLIECDRPIFGVHLKKPVHSPSGSRLISSSSGGGHFCRTYTHWTGKSTNWNLRGSCRFKSYRWFCGVKEAVSRRRNFSLAVRFYI